MMALCAIALGAAPGLVGAKVAVLALLALLPVPLILKDYRIGVVLLTLALPVASMLPPVRGLNLLNFLTLATLGSFGLQSMFSKSPPVGLPPRMWLCFVLPVSIAMGVAWPFIPEAARNYAASSQALENYEPVRYLLDRFVKPLFYHLSYAFLLANAVHGSRQPQRFVALVAASVLLPAAAVVYTVAAYPGTLADVARDREFLAPRGMHANCFGLLFAMACGPLLFVGVGAATRWLRWLAMAAFGVATVGLLLTFSRGALLAWLIVVSACLLHLRRVRTLLAGVVLIVAALLAAPDALTERFGTGLRADALSDTTDVARDDLTAGRVHGWLLLLPEVARSPLIGRGLGSTQWSQAVAQGQYRATHPHNVYLEILMDMGLIGFAALAWWIAREFRALRRSAASPALPADLRVYFRGAWVAVLGLLAMAATTSDYMPYNGSHFYLWFSFGMVFGLGDGTAQASVQPAGPGRSFFSRYSASSASRGLS